MKAKVERRERHDSKQEISKWGLLMIVGDIESVGSNVYLIQHREGCLVMSVRVAPKYPSLVQHIVQPVDAARLTLSCQLVPKLQS